MDQSAGDPPGKHTAWCRHKANLIRCDQRWNLHRLPVADTFYLQVIKRVGITFFLQPTMSLPFADEQAMQSCSTGISGLMVEAIRTYHHTQVSDLETESHCIHIHQEKVIVHLLSATRKGPVLEDAQAGCLLQHNTSP